MPSKTVASRLDKQVKGQYDKSSEADAVRKRCREDIRFFYRHVLDTAKRGLGKVHDILLDFVRLAELDSLDPSVWYSELARNLPARVDGLYPERWLYFPTVGGMPQIQDGPDGPVSLLFHGENDNVRVWQGIIVRINGDGTDTCNMMPRGHLKTEIGIFLKTLYEIIRDQNLRHLIRCSTFAKAEQRVSQLKAVFDNNEMFQRLFGYMIPGLKERTVWNRTAFKLLVDGPTNREPTVMAGAIDAALAGYHFDRIRLDDVVDEVNSLTADRCESVRSKTEVQAFLGDPGFHIEDIGTKYADSDAHALWTMREFPGYASSSFMVATLRDAEDNPIWPEKFTEPVVAKYRRMLSSDFHWFCQMYNQPVAGDNSSFCLDWLDGNRFSDPPPAVAAKKKLDLFMVVDPASTTEKRSDYTAAVVIGQDPITKHRFLLDGLREKLSPDKLVGALAEMILKWQDLAEQEKLSFRFGIESFGFQQYLQFPLRDKLRGIGRNVHIEELHPKRRRKEDRIKVLATPFSAGRYKIPDGIRRVNHATGRDYDFVGYFIEEFKRWPRSLHDDILDVLAYTEEMLAPGEVFEEPKASAATATGGRDVYGSTDFEGEQDATVLRFCGWGIKREKQLGPGDRDLCLRGALRPDRRGDGLFLLR